MTTKIKGGGARKYGRNKLSCDTYEREGRREKNKVRRLEKHLKRFPDDVGAKKALAEIKR